MSSPATLSSTEIAVPVDFPMKKFLEKTALSIEAVLPAERTNIPRLAWETLMCCHSKPLHLNRYPMHEVVAGICAARGRHAQRVEGTCVICTDAHPLWSLRQMKYRCLTI